MSCHSNIKVTNTTGYYKNIQIINSKGNKFWYRKLSLSHPLCKEKLYTYLKTFKRGAHMREVYSSAFHYYKKTLETVNLKRRNVY